MRSKSLIALATASAMALPLTGNATGDYVQHKLAFVPHATLETTAYPQNQVQIEEFGGPVNPYIWERPLINHNPWGPHELVSVVIPAPASMVASSSQINGSGDSASTGMSSLSSSGMSSGGSRSSTSASGTITWYLPDGTVAHQQFNGAAPASGSASTGSSALSMDSSSMSESSASSGSSALSQDHITRPSLPSSSESSSSSGFATSGDSANQ